MSDTQRPDERVEAIREKVRLAAEYEAEEFDDSLAYMLAAYDKVAEQARQADLANASTRYELVWCAHDVGRYLEGGTAPGFLERCREMWLSKARQEGNGAEFLARLERAEAKLREIRATLEGAGIAETVTLVIGGTEYDVEYYGSRPAVAADEEKSNA